MIQPRRIYDLGLTHKAVAVYCYAYALASDEEKELIEQFFIKTEEKLKNHTTEQLRGYSYGMLGVDLSVKIEKWIIEKELTEKVISEEDLLSLIVEFFLQNEECKLKDKLYEICCLWIKGRTPIEISLETGCDISNVDDVCNKVISYRLSILIGNICDLINVPEDDDTKVNPYTTLNILQNKIKYGISSQTAIPLYIYKERELMLMKKITFNAPLNHKAYSYEPMQIEVEKVIPLYGKRFEQMRDHPLEDAPEIIENRDLMYMKGNTTHCIE